MSERNFAPVFRSETGTTPAEFVEKARIDAARRLADESDLPVKRLAHEVGYANVDGFRRAFTRRLGRQPGRIPQALCEVKTVDEAFR
jgi:transcriptional regulator GlxA family with amidase domain